ncbi:MAG: hypothetical protein ACTSXL_05390 [Alphaproteobacteria bacterium]
MKKILFIVLLFPMVAFSFEGTFFAFNKIQTVKKTSKICSDLSNIFCVIDTYFLSYILKNKKLSDKIKTKYPMENNNFPVDNDSTKKGGSSADKIIFYQIKDIQTHKTIHDFGKGQTYKRTVKNSKTGEYDEYDVAILLEFKEVYNRSFFPKNNEVYGYRLILKLKKENKKWISLDETIFECYDDESCT